MNKKTYLITGLVGLVILLGAGCTTEQTTNSPVNTASTSTNSTVPVQGKYENSTYGFSLVFPETWGTIREKKQENNGGKIYAAIQLFGANDKAQFIKIQVVKNEDKTDPAMIDYPQKYLIENSTYSYYYTTNTEAYPNNELNDDPAMQKEIKEIINTFKLTEEVTQTQDIVYTNSEYAFTLTLPQAWKDFSTQLGPKADGKAGTSDSVAFSLPDQTPLFIIEIYPETVWEDIQQADGPTPTYLAKNNQYVFGYSMTQDAKNETMIARIAEIKDIIKTFKLDTTELLSYSTTGVNASVSKTTAPFDYTTDELKANAADCGIQQAGSYFDDLIAKFSNTTKTIYSFKYTGESQESNTFVVTVLPNKAGYTSVDQFKKDFDICATGGDSYPKMLNTDWLLFESSCGSGRADDSKQPIGCDEVKKVVEPSLKLNSLL